MADVLLTVHCARHDAESLALALRSGRRAGPLGRRGRAGPRLRDAGTGEQVEGLLRAALRLIVAEALRRRGGGGPTARRRAPLRWHAVPVHSTAGLPDAPLHPAALPSGLIPAAGLAAPVAEVPPPNLPPEAVVVAALDNHPTVAAAGQRVSAARAAAALARGSHEVLVTGTIQARDVTNERRYAESTPRCCARSACPARPRSIARPACWAWTWRTIAWRTAATRPRCCSQLWFDWLTAGELHRVDLANAAVLDEALAAVTRRQQCAMPPRSTWTRPRRARPRPRPR
jgi:hypothetical protein